MNQIKSEDVNLELGHGQQRMWKYADAVCLKLQHKVEALLARSLPVDVLTHHRTHHHQGNQLHLEVNWQQRGMKYSVFHMLPVVRSYKVNLCGKFTNMISLHVKLGIHSCCIFHSCIIHLEKQYLLAINPPISNYVLSWNYCNALHL